MVSADYSSMGNDHRAQSNRITAGDLFVVVAMGIVAMAVLVGLSAQFGWDLPTAAGFAILTFLAMITGHIALRSTEARQKKRHHPGKPKQAQAQPGPLPLNQPNSDEPKIGEMGKSGILPVGAETALNRTGKQPAVQPPKPDLPVTELKSKLGPQPDGPGDLGRVRPRQMPDLSEASSVTSSSERASAGTISDAGMIDDMIKRLANDIEAGRKELPVAHTRDASLAPDAASTELNGPPPRASGAQKTGQITAEITAETTAQKTAQKTATAHTVQAGTPGGVATPPAVPEPSAAEPTLQRNNAPVLDVSSPPKPGLSTLGAVNVAPVTGDEQSLQLSKSAKHPLAPTMQEAARNVPPVPTQPSPRSATAKLAAIADALSDEQLDVFLETINGLDDFRAQHYEVSVRIRLTDGQSLDNAAFISETRGTGLLPLLEAVKVSSTKRLAVQMIRRGRSGDFFTAVDGEALSEQQFGADVETITAGEQALAARLVLAFSQADVRRLTPAQMSTMDAIAALGFRFSVEAITDLDMDFEALAKRGFAFAKLDAGVFLDGLPIGTVRVPSRDICKHLDDAGLAVIVGKIADEASRARIASFGARLGQGALFGLPRPVRSDVLRSTEQRPVAV